MKSKKPSKNKKKKVLPKEAFEENAKIYKVFAHEKRLEILNNIKYKELSVEELLDITKIPKSNLSQHLALLRHCGLVKNRREGKSVYYTIIDPRVIEPCKELFKIWQEKHS